MGETLIAGKPAATMEASPPVLPPELPPELPPDDEFPELPPTLSGAVGTSSCLMQALTAKRQAILGERS